MTGPACVVFDRTLCDYKFSDDHPFNPIRVELTMQLADELGVTGAGGLPIVPAPMGTEELVATVHDSDYIEAVKRASRNPLHVDLARGIGTDDDPAFAGMHEASVHVVGATVEAARRMWSGETLHAVNVAGGHHHAMPGRASGFGIYNDIAIGIQWLLDNGAKKIAYVDVDAHHGDGTQTVFWNDPRVLTISIHETGQALFPGTGFANEVGGEGAEGTAVNVALPPGTGDAGWLRAFYAVVPDLVREFKPDVLVTQHGCDSHVEDPLTHLALTVDGQRASYTALHALAHEVAGGKWLAVGGGGYAVVDVVPRIWSHLLGIVGGVPVDPAAAVPDAWRAHVRERLGVAAPMVMTDGRAAAYRDIREGFDPGTWLDRSIMATREAVFPLNGLDFLP